MAGHIAGATHRRFLAMGHSERRRSRRQRRLPDKGLPCDLIMRNRARMVSLACPVALAMTVTIGASACRESTAVRGDTAVHDYAVTATYNPYSFGYGSSGTYPYGDSTKSLTQPGILP